MKKKIAPVMFAALIGVLVTGCEAQEEPLAANQIACDDFSALSMKLAEPFSVDSVKAPWEAMRDEFDSIALSAEGDVKDRISKMVAEWPGVETIIVYKTGVEVINENAAAVGRACSADGYDIQVGGLSA